MDERSWSGTPDDGRASSDGLHSEGSTPQAVVISLMDIRPWQITPINRDSLIRAQGFMVLMTETKEGA